MVESINHLPTSYMKYARNRASSKIIHTQKNLDSPTKLFLKQKSCRKDNSIKQKYFNLDKRALFLAMTALSVTAVPWYVLYDNMTT